MFLEEEISSSHSKNSINRRFKEVFGDPNDKTKSQDPFPLLALSAEDGPLPAHLLDDDSPSSSKLSSSLSSSHASFVEQSNDETPEPVADEPADTSSTSADSPSSSVEVNSNNTEPSMRLASTNGIFGSLAKAAVGVATGAASGKPGATKGPKSAYGVPSFVDEQCVLCQYFVELAQHSLYDHLTLGRGDEYPHQNDLREINQQVMTMPNGRGIVRIVIENTMILFCDPQSIPELFYKHCDKLWEKLHKISHAVFFQYGAAAVCVEVSLCSTFSYANEATSVHLPLKSKVYNSGRGKCGMMGGIHEDSSSLTKTVLCTAQKLLLN